MLLRIVEWATVALGAATTAGVIGGLVITARYSVEHALKLRTMPDSDWVQMDTGDDWIGML